MATHFVNGVKLKIVPASGVGGEGGEEVFYGRGDSVAALSVSAGLEKEIDWALGE